MQSESFEDVPGEQGWWQTRPSPEEGGSTGPDSGAPLPGEPHDVPKPKAPASNSPESEKKAAAPKRVIRLAPAEQVEAHAKKRRELLTSIAPDAAPDELVRLVLAADELMLFDVLRDAQLQAALRVSVLVDNPTVALALTKALRNTSDVASAVAKRVQQSLLTASTLRAQRRLLSDSRH